jgi:CDP-diglyceride synthetase
MEALLAVFLFWHFEASWYWWVALVLVFILQVAHEMNKIYNKKHDKR